MITYEFALCPAKPTIVKIAECYVVVFQSSSELERSFAERHHDLFDLLLRGSRHVCDVPEWKLPDDSRSRDVEYHGKRFRISKIRFGILKRLLLSGGPVPYHEIAKVGWGRPTDPDVLQFTIYQFNKFLKKHGIPKFIHCQLGTVFLADKKSSKS